MRTVVTRSYSQSILVFLLLLCVFSGRTAAAPAAGADGQFSESRSSHFILYQDVAIDQRSGWRGSRRFERDVLEALETAFARVEAWLGLRPLRPVRVVVYDAEVFDREFAGIFRFAAAGFYHGVIRVRSGTSVDQALVRVLYHEYVHAAFDARAASVVLPAWVNEGVAEWIEHRAIGQQRLAAWQRETLAQAAHAGELPSLDTLMTANLGYLEGRPAALAYLQAYAFIEHLARRYGEHSLRQFLELLLRTQPFERALRTAFRGDLGRLEADFRAELHGLATRPGKKDGLAP